MIELREFRKLMILTVIKKIFMRLKKNFFLVFRDWVKKWSLRNGHLFKSFAKIPLKKCDIQSFCCPFFSSFAVSF